LRPDFLRPLAVLGGAPVVVVVPVVVSTVVSSLMPVVVAVSSLALASWVAVVPVPASVFMLVLVSIFMLVLEFRI
jgi:hypothetical protein